MIFQIINLDIINESMMGNADLIKELVDLYISQSPGDFKALEDALSTGDTVLIRKTAHHIKPTMQYIGAKDLLQDFQVLENMAKEGVPIEEMNAQFQKIKPKFSLMLEELQQLSIS
ncbi:MULTISPECIES: Hpt domain-containing protein [Sphingobacterium]|jgi:HPt (histidine-containing phosphotransfer) domain-containing protein|uniref:Hpt domain-containing protein n=1 Tax=Sphingobacterium litopenaei TaxID=2763500 RepID=A0ABR7YCP9_9SPHI|nr:MULTISPECIES: Hpt domain-containing protein [Sphingobacterium]MBD1428983.1 Hpt domain-containing protein [Sphingobacterium litopenaei]NGM74088.1 Hpt domain-containing protein [Sphingobacterium sp. SGL-16]